MAITVLTDDLDMAGHHLLDWRYLEDIPQGSATTDQVLTWDGTSWTPTTISTGGGLTSVSWDDVTGKPAEFPAEAHQHVSADITDWLTTDLHVAALYSQTALYANEQMADDPAVLQVYNPSGTDGVLSFNTSGSLPNGWRTESAMMIGYITTANAILRLGNGISTNGTLYIGQENLTSHATRGLVTSRSVYVGNALHVVGTSTLAGLSTHQSGVSTNTISEYTAAAGVTIDGVLLKDSQVSTDVINELTGAAGVTIDGVKLKDSEVYTDVVREKTAAAGVTVDGVLLKDNGVSATWSTNGASKSMVVFTDTITFPALELGTTYKSYDSVLSFTNPAAAGAVILSTLKSFDSTITLTAGGAPAVYSVGVHPFASSVNAGGLAVTTTGSAAPVHFLFTNPSSGQLFAEGYLSVDVTGGSSAGDVIAAFTRARVSGSATGVGYRGYATDASGATGTITGVNGFVVISAGSTGAGAMAFDATVNGTAIAYGKRMAFRGSNHVLVRGGSLVLATGTPATPNAVTTGHLDLTAGNSELFVGGKAEIDGELFMDGNTSLSVATTTSTSYNAGTATVILANANGAAITVNLPAASGKSGRLYVVKKTDSSVNTVTIDGNASETIDGATTYVLTAQYQVVQIICDGSNWHIISVS